MATRKVRYKKLSVKTPLGVLRENQIDREEYESLTNEAQIATGVEQAEENEYHLQAVLQSAGVAVDKEIPVPPPQESTLNYDELYARPFSKTSTYIRFSQTVEESVGCMYDLTEDDEVFLKSYNQKRAASAQLSEFDFEMIMEVFEDTSEFKAPFASIDQTIVPYDDMLRYLQDLDRRTKVMPHAKEIYEYWKSRRQALNNQPLHPTLKFEKHQESDEADPFVCFRRREVRQTRKTRARDVQSADKLKRLRKELEDARQLVLAAHNREVLKAEMLKSDRAIFEVRAQLKEHKIRLGIKTDDEDLINQKPQKRKAPDVPTVQRPPLPAQLRVAVRPTHPENDLSIYADRQAEKENELRLDIEKKVLSHTEWNRNHLDLTRGPLSPAPGPRREPGFRPAKTQYLMTPPTSAASDSLEEPTAMDLDKPEEDVDAVFHFRGVTQDQEARKNPPAYRRRIGRLGRLWIDRRGMASPPHDVGAETRDRWKYDESSDEEEDPPKYEVDPFDTNALRFRASIPLPPWMTNRAAVPTARVPLPPPQLPPAVPQLQPPPHPQQSQQPPPQPPVPPLPQNAT
ncbi:enhancer of polycomb-like-domain-containing protein [Chaetomium sp. MPI-SDFR-AT-0129]|uniref:Enhancer of polycomb-like protein n=1 Tax=Dichotomopilus funicola TaxID=1934379 RepID=A0AAN6ZRG9_9PEZI|nr:enhancer of polycomb-like-domain-containing protein [Chaetomium sp. MPI-SDFR-AT-0129]KAK4148222.1 enhancer of polycomb-like protein 1 [Dichotomopilus funicola]